MTGESDRVDSGRTAARVPGLAVGLVGLAVAFATTVVWVGLGVAACLATYTGAVRGEVCAPSSSVPWMLTIPAVAIGAAAAWRSQRWWPVVLGGAITVLPLLAFLFAPSGLASWNDVGSPRDQVADAMEELAYDYRFLSGQDRNGYVVFEVGASNTGGVRFAYAGQRRPREPCPRPPEPFLRKRDGSKSFAASGPEPLICLDGYSPRPPAGRAPAVVDLSVDHRVADALCKQAYDFWTCFD
jgi:hypothetical protein